MSVTSLARFFDGVLTRIAALLFVLPLFLILLCQYLNPYDRVAEPGIFIAVAALLFAAITAVIFWSVLLLRTFATRVCQGILTATDVLFLSIVVVSIFFPVQHALLDGQELHSVATAETLKQTLIPLAVFGICAFIRWRRQQLFPSLHKAVLLLCSGSVVFMLVALELDSRAQKGVDVVRQEAPALLGERNVILLVVETFQGSYLEGLAKEDPQIFSAFTGMTLFSKATTSTPWSPFSTNQIFTGDNSWEKYGTRQEAIEALTSNSLISSGKKAGFVFSGGKYTPLPGYEGLGAKEVQFSLGVFLPRIILEHSKVYFATVRRILPARLWGRLQTIEQAIYTKYLMAGQFPGKIKARDEFLNFTESLSTGNGKSFLYFFNYMTHFELLFSRDGVPTPGMERNKRNQLEEYRYTLSLYANFLERLKSLGKYDDTLIVITGDHGSYFEHNRAYNPALFIKPPRAEGALAINDANVNLTDIRPLVEAFFESDSSAALVFKRLAEANGPRKLSLYSHISGDHDSGFNWRCNEIEGDLDVALKQLGAK